MSFLSWLDRIFRAGMTSNIEEIHTQKVEEQEKTIDQAARNLRRLRAELNSYKGTRRNR